MDSILDYIDMLDSLVLGRKGVPFSSKVSIEKAEMADILQDMRLALPNEIRQAQKIIDDNDRIISDAKNKATSIIHSAEETAKEMLYETEIFKRAEEEGKREVEDARRYSRELRSNTLDYADSIMNDLEAAIRDVISSISLTNRAIEDSLGKTLEEIYDNRQQLRDASMTHHTGSQRVITNEHDDIEH